jgi:RNA-directed DNA polymerase
MEAVVDPANLRRAWKQVRANHGAPGPDGITLAAFPEWLRPRWPTIRQQLLEGTFLANILLDDLDQELERRGLPFVRYADDFVIFTRSRRAAERVFRSVSRYLTRHLRLLMNETKSRIVEADGVEYLGFVFRGRRATINVSEENQSQFKRRIRKLTGRSRGISMDRRMSELRSYLRGWMGYFGWAAQLKLFDHLDQWLRRRLRMCYWKRWRYVRTR